MVQLDVIVHLQYFISVVLIDFDIYFTLMAVSIAEREGEDSVQRHHQEWLIQAVPWLQNSKVQAESECQPFSMWIYGGNLGQKWGLLHKYRL